MLGKRDTESEPPVADDNSIANSPNKKQKNEIEGITAQVPSINSTAPIAAALNHSAALILEDIPRSWDTPEFRFDGGELPDGWAFDEDLGEDIAALIERYQRRIAQKIAPSFFAKKIQELEGIRELKRELLEAEPGVDWNEALRLNTLNACQEWLESKGDPNKELPNVISIIDAYRSGELTWEEGKVTYWRGGRNVGGPPDEFTWERFHELNGNNKGEGFWIEPIPDTNMFVAKVYKGWPRGMGGIYGMNISVKMGPSMDLVDKPQNRPEFDLRYMDDTGATLMSLFPDDVVQLQSGSTEPPWPQIMGVTNISSVVGEVGFHLVIAIWVNMFNKPCSDKTRESYLPGGDWVAQPATVSEKGPLEGGCTERLSGSWLRDILYSATAPEIPGNVYFYRNVGDLRLPNIPETKRGQRPIFHPSQGARWGWINNAKRVFHGWRDEVRMPGTKAAILRTSDNPRVPREIPVPGIFGLPRPKIAAKSTGPKNAWAAGPPKTHGP